MRVPPPHRLSGSRRLVSSTFRRPLELGREGFWLHHGSGYYEPWVNVSAAVVFGGLATRTGAAMSIYRVDGTGDWLLGGLDARAVTEALEAVGFVAYTTDSRPSDILFTRAGTPDWSELN